MQKYSNNFLCKGRKNIVMTISGIGYYAGGVAQTKELYSIDLKTNVMTKLADMIHPAERGYCAILNDILYVVGGEEKINI